jgi:hypothetical protein
MILHGRRFSLTTQTGWPRQVRVPLGGTLHRHRSDTMRSLSITRQENGKRREQPVECRAATAFLRIEEI